MKRLEKQPADRPTCRYHPQHKMVGYERHTPWASGNPHARKATEIIYRCHRRVMIEGKLRQCPWCSQGEHEYLHNFHEARMIANGHDYLSGLA
jgi:hypothetical protein